MSTVDDYVKCPQCNGVLHNTFNCSTQEESGSCNSCGYFYSIDLILDEKGQPVLNEDGKLTYKDKKEKGYGAYFIKSMNGMIGQMGGFNEPITEETIKVFKEAFSNPDVDAEHSFLIAYEDGEFKVLLGNVDVELLDYDAAMKHFMEEHIQAQLCHVKTEEELFKLGFNIIGIATELYPTLPKLAIYESTLFWIWENEAGKRIAVCYDGNTDCHYVCGGTEEAIIEYNHLHEAIWDEQIVQGNRLAAYGFNKPGDSFKNEMDLFYEDEKNAEIMELRGELHLFHREGNDHFSYWQTFDEWNDKRNEEALAEYENQY